MTAEQADPQGAQGPWGLPEDWGWVPLSTTCEEIVGGGTPTRSNPDYFGGSVVWVTPSDLDAREPIEQVTTSRSSLTDLGLSSSSARLVPAGTVLFSSRATIGKVAIAGVPLSTNQGFANFVCKDWLDSEYLALCLYTLKDEIKKLAGSTTYLEVSRGKLRNFRIPLPTFKEPNLSLKLQRRIVTRVKALLADVKKARILLDDMRLDAEKLLSAAVNQVLAAGEMEVIPLGSVATAFNGRASGQGTSAVRVFKTRHVYPHSPRLDRPSYMKAEQVQKLPPDRFLQAGDVLMANIAEGTLGRVSYVEEAEANWTVDTQIMILRSFDEGESIVGKWLYYYLWSEAGQREILARRSGIAFADKRGQTHIYPKNVLDIPVPLPTPRHESIDRQLQAITYLDTIQSEVKTIQESLAQDAAHLDQLEESILGRALKGEV